ncbi:BRISC and BRCA1-A complex member 2 [Nomia melanderi]|uniref:BRISC and BRCA1-A complex member 2 n=1 Tax=Nomia melanderi TaxID=2448451 RepID=UPI0013047955|nr:BRISC and BRCA1-A complex member 2-like [Nomia melanderi]
MLNQQYNILHHTDSFIEPLLKRTLEANKLGVCCGTIQIESVSSSCDKVKGDRFKLSIPYARQTLTWNVFFDSQCPEMGPDFIFNDDTFLMDVNIDTLSTAVPSLAKWNIHDKDALLNVLMELLSCYKQHQIQLLQKQDRLKLEYSMLMGSSEIAPEDVEVMLLPFGSKPTEAKFLISLSIDVSQLQNSSFELENDIVMLLVTFCGPNWNRIIPQLYFSKSLEQILGGTSALHLPHYPADKCLTDYILEIKMYIAEKIKPLVQSLEKRRLFVTTVLALQPGSLIEFDATDYRYITLLLERQDFSYMLHFRLSSAFPTEKPTVVMQSIYHMTRLRFPYEEKVENFDYSNQWAPAEMIEEILLSVNRMVEKFKDNSIEICS